MNSRIAKNTFKCYTLDSVLHRVSELSSTYKRPTFVLEDIRAVVCLLVGVVEGLGHTINGWIKHKRPHLAKRHIGINVKAEPHTLPIIWPS